MRNISQGGSISALSGCRWIHTPGHSAGHVLLWREVDRALIAGDAVVTVASESAYATATQIHDPAKYFHPAWVTSKRLADELASLEPEIVVTGHGRAPRGPAMRNARAHQPEISAASSSRRTVAMSAMRNDLKKAAPVSQLERFGLSIWADNPNK